MHFDEPSKHGRSSDLATEEVAPKDVSPSELDVEFVTKETEWRSAHIQHRNNNLFKAGGLYATALGAVVTYSAFGFKLLENSPSGESRVVFAAAGIGLVWILFVAGLFLIRFAGYTFSSNIMNRKRMVALRAAYAKSCGVLHLIPPPRRVEDVWVSGGLKSFPYMFAIMNFLLLLFHIPYFYLLYDTTIGNPIMNAAAATAVVVMLTAIFYPRGCHRYRSDIFVAEHFYEDTPTMSGYFRETQKQLKDYYNYRLKQVERANRPRQAAWLRVYIATTVVAAVGSVAYIYAPQEGKSWILLMGLPLFGIVVILRIMTLQYRFPPND